jgi:nucleotide-binding universal stress UspA family protein
MFNRILVPLDGSPLAEQVLPYVKILAKGLNAPVKLLRAVSPAGEELADPAHQHYPHQVDENIRQQALDYLRSAGAALSSLGVPISYETPLESPAAAIINEAEKEPGTLVAMSTHGRSGIARWVVGSVTGKVLHATTSPLLVIRPTGEQPSSDDIQLKTALVPLDGSELAEQSLPYVAALAKALDLDIQLCRVTPSAEEYSVYFEYQPVGSGANVYSGPYEEFSRAADASAMSYLHDVRQKLHRQRVWSVEETLLRGRPASAIVDAAHAIPGSLVIMTTHGRSGIGRWLLGSVTDRVVRESGVPVLVVRSSHESSA